MIKGKRVNLRPVTAADLPLLESWANDSESQSYNFFGLRDVGRLRRGFEENGMLGEKGGTLLVVRADDGVVVGDVGYHQTSFGPNAGSQFYNIGITLLPEHRGQGYGVEAQVLLGDYLFATYTIKRIEASTDITNLPEQRALTKAGFTREGVARQAQWRDGDWHDMVTYSKLRGE